jgi:hypothetical protein
LASSAIITSGAPGLGARVDRPDELCLTAPSVCCLRAHEAATGARSISVRPFRFVTLIAGQLQIGGRSSELSPAHPL